MAHARGTSHANYFAIFIALCVLTALSVAADIVRPNSWLLLAVIVFAVATAKALFVMLYFMHLKFEGKWKYVLLAPTIILACGIPLALLPDIGVKYYVLDVPQMWYAPVEQSNTADAPHTGEGGHGH